MQSKHTDDERNNDAYFTPPEAIQSLIDIERVNIPRVIWEPAAGDGAISRVLVKNGYGVLSTDLYNYGWDECVSGVDYLQTQVNKFIPFAMAKAGLTDKYVTCMNFGIVTNPPFKLALEFARKALNDSNSYVAFLLRTNFLEGIERMTFFRNFPPSRVWISSRRLPMMHRHGWDGPKAPSNTCHAWFVWDARTPFEQRGRLRWFDWRDHARPMLLPLSADTAFAT